MSSPSSIVTVCCRTDYSSQPREPGTCTCIYYILPINAHRLVEGLHPEFKTHQGFFKGLWTTKVISFQKCKPWNPENSGLPENPFFMFHWSKIMLSTRANFTKQSPTFGDLIDFFIEWKLFIITPWHNKILIWVLCHHQLAWYKEFPRFT